MTKIIPMKYLTPEIAAISANRSKKTLIKKGASIGANATIICGNTISEYAMVGAGSVVTKNVAPYALVVGNPAKQIAWVSKHGEKLTFKNDRALCPTSGEKYILKGSKLHPID